VTGVRRRSAGQPALTLALVAGGLLAAAPVRAHDESVSSSDIVVEGARVTWTVDVGLAGLAKVVALSRSPDVVERAGVPLAELEDRREAITRYLSGQVAVRLDGRQVAVRPGALRPLYETVAGNPAITRVALALEFEAPGVVDRLEARVGFFADLTRSHRAVIRIQWGDERQQLTRLGVSELRFERGRVEPSVWRVLGDFLAWGVHHILVGYDHIAFLLALLLAVGRVRQLVVIVTAFTLAHSATILLAAMELVRLPSAITEALIAASIVYVAAENLVLGSRAPRGRAVLAFVFGLVHGLGFAEVLRDRLAETPGGILAPVLAFNLGVELGQLAIVALAFPLLLWLRRQVGERRVLRWGSTAILALGLFWLGSRLL
jgi:hydrogenase/urease accessory protein HupE